MGLPLGDLSTGDVVQYKDPGIDNTIYKVEGYSYKATGRGKVADRVKIGGRWEMAALLERPPSDDVST